MKNTKMVIGVMAILVAFFTSIGFGEISVGTVREGYTSLWFSGVADNGGKLETDYAGNVYSGGFGTYGGNVYKYLPDNDGDTYSDGKVKLTDHSTFPGGLCLSQDGRYLFTGHESGGWNLHEYDLQTQTGRKITTPTTVTAIATRMVGGMREIFTNQYSGNSLLKIVDINPTDDYADAVFTVAENAVLRDYCELKWGPGATLAGNYGTDLFVVNKFGSLSTIDVDATSPESVVFSDFSGISYDFDVFGDFGGYMYGALGKSIYDIAPDGTWGDPFATYTDEVKHIAFAKDGSALYAEVGSNIVCIIPEPATLALFVLGGLFIRRRA